MTTTIKTLGATTAVILGLFAGSRVQAQSFQHIDRLASQLERQVRAVHEEVHLHFRLTSRYVHLDRDVAEMERLADHIHDVVHRGGSVAHLRSDVAQLDQRFHHIEDLVEFLARTREIDFRTYAHLRETLGAVGQTLHHLSDDLAQLDYRGDPYHGHSSYYPFGGYRPR